MNAMVENARALLRLMEKSPWRDIHVRTRDGMLFIAKEGGAANPMRTPAPERCSGPRIEVAAPHLASVVSILPVGSRVVAGDPVGRLELLGETIEIAAPEAGVVEAVFVQEGELVEYEAPLARIVGAA